MKEHRPCICHPVQEVESLVAWLRMSNKKSLFWSVTRAEERSDKQHCRSYCKTVQQSAISTPSNTKNNTGQQYVEKMTMHAACLDIGTTSRTKWPTDLAQDSIFQKRTAWQHSCPFYDVTPSHKSSLEAVDHHKVDQRMCHSSTHLHHMSDWFQPASGQFRCDRLKHFAGSVCTLWPAWCR